MNDIKIIGGRVVTFQDGPVRGESMNFPLVLEKTNIIINDGFISAIDSDSPAKETIDARGMLVIPGLVDSHTHVVFAGSREDEFEKRLKGISYQQIAKEGGGIASTVNATRDADKDTLINLARRRLEYALSWGTTSIEIKSGYGLSVDSEIKMLEVIDELKKISYQTIVPTFLGAHEFPRDRGREEYIDEILNQMIPQVSERGLARFIDVFCEEGVYTKEEAKRILLKGRDFGLLPRLHADEFVSSGGSELAFEVGAVSCDHLSYPSEKGLKEMKKAGTIAVLLPGVALFLGGKPAPARRLIEEGIPIAIASDFNPGSSPLLPMPIVMNLACLFYKITPREALCASTINAAYVIREEDRGVIEEGKRADILICDCKNENEIPYWLGFNPVQYVIKDGRKLIGVKREDGESGRQGDKE
ncbi:imidazolonepropionase, partial [candidate division WOR-3 bacterium]|nr:imidazolonepropionase [candidate division WOR-3 bacterium]